MTIDEARDFIAEQSWTFAKTYASWAPHEYVVREQIDQQGFDDLADYINTHGFHSYFGNNPRIYCEIDHHHYWVLGNIINRCDYDDYKMAYRFYKRNK